ncbi:hypothetical protein NX722_07990 [Endozoicomonas gorgoniicola]|uniref:Uncharacterized protein n=1 Tax=Endozoicomonas gorgoniicola TaxID=1234144 RepID=A0ABT3MT93_9GAMM|nr:hypothetical protein [Endozoicomonas gorgoniicola]MCW7552590.1 hypothetical protein [Endozoicomonas gorgoniicola]
MSTEKELKALRKGELQTMLKGLSEQLGEEFPTSGTNNELIERILNTQDMLALDEDEQEETETLTDSRGEQSTESEPEATSDTYHIRAKSKTGFYRCGKFWPHEGRTIKAEMLSDDQISQLKAETNLIIE